MSTTKKRGNTSNDEKTLWVFLGATAVVAVVPAVGVGAGIALTAWSLGSRARASMPASYTVPTLAELRERLGGRLWGKPGEHAAKLALRHTGTGWATAVAGVAVIAASVWASVTFHGGVDAAASVVTAAIGAVAGLLAARVRPQSSWAAAGRARAGCRQEFLTLQAIASSERVDGVVVGWMPPGRVGDIDAAVITKSGVLIAVETKTGTGELSLNGDAVVAGDKQILGNPVNQVHTVAKAAHEELGVPVLPVVCVPRATGQTQHPETGVWVVGGDALAWLIEWADAQPVGAPDANATIARLVR